MEQPTFALIHQIFDTYCFFTEQEKQESPQECINQLSQGISKLYRLNDPTHHLDHPDHQPAWIYCFLEAKLHEAIEMIPSLLSLLEEQPREAY